MSRFAVNKALGRGVGDDATPSPSSRYRLRRTAIIITAIALVTVVVAVVTDLVSASVAEHRFSTSLAASPDLEYHPEVTLSGFPFLTHAAAGSFTGAVITARGVPAPGCAYGGGCFAELGATLGSFTTPNGLRIAPDDVLDTRSVSAYSLLNSVNLGRFLGIVDLSVNTPATADRVGGGGPQFGNLERASGVVLTGTVALPPSSAPAPDGRPSAANAPSASEYSGPKVKVSVAVDLSVTDGRLHLKATDFYLGPEEHVGSEELAGADNGPLRQAVLDRFSATLPRLPMPWDLPATSAHSAGSDVVLVAESGARQLRPDEF